MFFDAERSRNTCSVFAKCNLICNILFPVLVSVCNIGKSLLWIFLVFCNSYFFVIMFSGMLYIVAPCSFYSNKHSFWLCIWYINIGACKPIVNYVCVHISSSFYSLKLYIQTNETITDEVRQCKWNLYNAHHMNERNSATKSSFIR